MPAECEAGFFVGEHPWLRHYLTLGAGDCTATGSTGVLEQLSPAPPAAGSRSNFDLSAYAGKNVEVSIAYVTDPGSGGRGVLADDASLVVGGRRRRDRGLRDVARRLERPPDRPRAARPS